MLTINWRGRSGREETYYIYEVRLVDSNDNQGRLVAWIQIRQ
jgi:hypothetical protein